MAWIESHDDIWEHWKRIKLSAMTGLSETDTIGHLVSLWHFTLRNAWKDANLEPWGDDGIEKASRWIGEKGIFVHALRACELLDNFVVHGWLKRAGKLVSDRLYNEQRKSYAVKRRKSSFLRRKKFATLPYPTLPNHTLHNNTPQPPLRGEDKVLEWFEKMWEAYPKERRKGKKACLQAYRKAVKTLEQAREVARSLDNYLENDTVKKGYIRNADTWFRNWEDTKDDRRGTEGVFNDDVVGKPSPASPRGGGFATPDTILQHSADHSSLADREPVKELGPGSISSDEKIIR